MSETPSRLTVAAAIEAVFATHAALGRKPKTVTSYRYHLAHFAAFCVARGRVYLDEITPADLMAHFADLRDRGYSAGTVRIAGICVARIWGVAEKGGTLNGPNVWKRIEAPQAQTNIEPAWTADELLRLLNTARGGRHYALLLVLLDTGARIGELLALQRRHVDLATGRIVIADGKTGGRVTFMCPATVAVLAGFLEETGGRRASDRVFPVSGSAVRDWMHRIARRAGLENVHPHRFRRQFAVLMLRNGSDMERLRRLMGHRDFTMLQRHYLPLVDADLADAHRRCSPVAGLHLGGGNDG